MSNGDFAGKSFKVGLSDTPVFPPGTILSISEVAFGDYRVAVTEHGDCKPNTNPLTATASSGMLTTQPFTVECQAFGTEYEATAAIIGGGFIAGAVKLAGTVVEDDDTGNPTGTYTAEEEGGGGVET